MCGCCVSECNSMEADPDFLGPAALAKGMRFVGDARDQATVERLQEYSRRARDLGLHALLLLPGALPEGRRPARCDREARRRGDRATGSTPTWARSTRSGSSPRRRRPAGCARPSSSRRRRASCGRSRRSKFAMGLLRHGKVPPPVPPHVAKHVDEARALYDLVKQQDATAPTASSRSRRRSRASSSRTARSATRTARARSPRRCRREAGRTSEDRRVLQGLPRVALGEGARHLDAGARAEGRARADRARGGHVLRRRRHPRGRARLLPAPERAHPRVRGGDGRGHADDGLQRLHAQPPAGEPRAQERRRAPRAREREPRLGRRAAVLGRRRGHALPLADLRGRGLRAAAGRRAQGAEGAQDRAVLRLPDPPPVEAPRLRGSRTSRSRSSGSSRRAAARRSTIRRRSSAAASRSSRRARTSRSPSSSSRSSRRRRPARTRW